MATPSPDQPAPGEITRLLHAAAEGDVKADERLFDLVYGELRTLAQSLLRREKSGTLDPTALVNEAFLRLDNRHTIGWANRHHFFGVAARAMRRVLVDRARARARDKRAGHEVTLPEDLLGASPAETIIAVHEALERLAAIDPRRARVVELRWFGGLDIEAIAEMLGVGSATVKRDWAAAKAWLAVALAES